MLRWKVTGVLMAQWFERCATKVSRLWARILLVLVFVERVSLGKRLSVNQLIGIEPFSFRLFRQTTSYCSNYVLSTSYDQFNGTTFCLAPNPTLSL